MPDEGATPLSDYSGIPEEIRGLVDIVLDRLVRDFLEGRFDDSTDQEQRGSDANP
jgi:hypothetical protein